MNRLAALVATALLAPPALAHGEAPVVLDHRTLLAAADDARVQADAWKRWAEDFSHEMRSSMGTMFGQRLGPGKLVKGAPYSAQVVTETNQTLSDGNVITRRKQGAIYRDGEGRTRQEMPGDGKEPTVFITDPVDGKQLILTPGAKRAIETHALLPGSFVVKDKDKHVVRVDGKEVRVENGKVTIDGEVIVERDGTTVVKSIRPSGDGTRREEVRVQVIRSGDGVSAPVPPVPPMPPLPPGALSAPLVPMPPMPGVPTFRFESPARLGKGATTQLGTKDYEGVKAEGKSTVWTIPAGEIGNRNPINVTSESWYSPDLQLTVYSRYNDPRTGETIYRLAGIRRGEPAAELFRVPADFEVKKRERGGARRAP